MSILGRLSLFTETIRRFTDLVLFDGCDLPPLSKKTMKTSIVLLRIGGVLNLLFAALHIGFWNMFDWSEQLALLSVENSNIMQMLNLVLIIFFVYTAFVLLVMPVKLLENPVGRIFIALFAVLYFSRLLMEFYFPGYSLVFAAIMVGTILTFTMPLIQTKRLSHENQ